MSDHVSPNNLNYQIPKGKIYFTPEGGARRDLGNAPAISFEMSVETLPHYSSREGIRNKDFEPVIEVGGTLSVTLDEITEANLRIALLGGESEANTAGNSTFVIGAQTQVRGTIEIEGTNQVGPRYRATFPSVSFRPASAINFIGDEYNELELEGEVLYSSTISGFGILEKLGTTEGTEGTEPATEPETA